MEDFFERIFWEDFFGRIFWEKFDKKLFEYGRNLFIKILVFVKIWVNGEGRKENLNP